MMMILRNNNFVPHVTLVATAYQIRKENHTQIKGNAKQSFVNIQKCLQIINVRVYVCEEEYILLSFGILHSID